MARLRGIVALGCAVALLGAGSASAAPTWLPQVDLSAPGRDAVNPEVAMDPAGNTVAIWERQSTANPSHLIQVSTRAPGGTFSAPVELSQRSTEPDILMTPSGEAVAIWNHFENPPGVYVIQVATRPPGATSFSPPVAAYVAPPEVIPTEVQLAVNDSGAMAIVLSRLDPDSGFEKVLCRDFIEITPDPPCPNPLFVEAVTRPPGGSFSEPVQISRKRPPHPPPTPGESELEKEERLEREHQEDEKESKLNASSPRVAIDEAGNVVAIWRWFEEGENVVQAAFGSAGGGFGAPVTISGTGGSSLEPDLDMDAAGNAIAVWHKGEGAARRVQATIRPPGGSFGPPLSLSPEGAVSDSPSLEVTPDGTAYLAWRLVGTINSYIQTSFRPPGGAFGPPVTISSGKDNPLFPDAALAPGGAAAVVWSGDSGINEVARGAAGVAGGALSSPDNLTQAVGHLLHPAVAVDAAGNATAVWSRSNGSHDIVQAAGFDPVPPELRALSAPSGGVVGEPLQFSVTPYDAWSVGPASFSFGDGTDATGNSVTHAYGVAGTYQVTVSAKDGAGSVTSQTVAVTVRPKGEFRLGKLKRNKKKGTVTLPVTVDGPGTIVASGKGLKKRTVRASAAGTVNVVIKATGKKLKALKRTGSLKLKVKVVFTPDGGAPSAPRTQKLKLIKTLG